MHVRVKNSKTIIHIQEPHLVEAIAPVLLAITNCRTTVTEVKVEIIEWF